ncbi:DUF2721 domain-containing protein [uncultured Thiodictyon sp.]|jgi:hypothetical protein|uniref:DUF2721 domain-containing protein n=1 Tax=uncultured Thiodictyon sp. TaxID=1846217 RepID=UPI0025D609D2|nr:DUF2721 domain-containing protein [uncultured Thiodictyon sp.]
MPTEPTISAISHLIQVAVAPVFLLAGIGSVLGVMANRLSRIVDRARVVEGVLTSETDETGPIHEEMLTLERRARIISLSIGLCTLTALLVCAVIAVMFLSAFFSFDTSLAVAALFILAMLFFICALTMLLREILLATVGLRFGPERK